MIEGVQPAAPFHLSTLMEPSGVVWLGWPSEDAMSCFVVTSTVVGEGLRGRLCEALRELALQDEERPARDGGSVS